MIDRRTFIDPVTGHKKTNGSGSMLPLYVPKVWGHEVILVTTELYTLKRLVVFPGWACSYHYHREKTETFLIESGVLWVEFGMVFDSRPSPSAAEGKRVLSVGQQMTLAPLMAHKFYTYGDKPCSFLEVSTMDTPEDSYRLTQSGPHPRIQTQAPDQPDPATVAW